MAGLPRRTAAELLHLAAGLALTLLVFNRGAWAYRTGRDTVLAVGWATALVVLLMGLPPLARAWARDRAGR